MRVAQRDGECSLQSVVSLQGTGPHDIAAQINERLETYFIKVTGVTMYENPTNRVTYALVTFEEDV